MIKIKPFLIQPVSRSLIPFLVGSTCYALKGLWLGNLQGASSHNLETFLGSSKMNQEMTRTQENVTSSEGLVMSFLSLISQICFGIYTNLWTFLLAVLFIDIIFRIAQNGFGKAKMSRLILSSFSEDSDDDSEMSNEKEAPKLFNLFSENQVLRILSYIGIFAVLQVAGLGFDLARSLSSNIHSQTGMVGGSLNREKISDIIMMMKNVDEEENYFNIPSRILEEKETEAIIIPTLQSSDKISLSMGNVLSSLNIDVTAMVLSKDKKTVFATLDYYGTLKIIDVSDLQSPVVVSSLSLKVSGFNSRIKSLTISPDEKTLYASNSRDLEIIDVSNIGTPKLVSFTASEIFFEDMFSQISRFYQPSLAFDEITSTLFIGGLGLQIYDVSSPKNPILLKAGANDLEESSLLKAKTLRRNEICLSHDGKFLFIANGTLDVYNISNSKVEIQKVVSLQTKSFPRSIFIHQDSKVALLLGTSPNDSKMILEEVDISDPKNPLIIETHNTDYKSSYSPRILAVSPSKNKVFIFVDDDYQGYDLVIYDLIKKTTIKNQKSLIESTQTMAFSQDGRFLITGSNDQFMIVELFLNYPNKQIFSGSSLQTISNFSRPTSILQMRLSSDGNLLYLLRSAQKPDSHDSIGVFEILDISDISTEPKALGSYIADEIMSSMYFRNNDNAVYLMSQHSLSVLDISNKSSLTREKFYESGGLFNVGFMQVVATSDEKTGIIAKYQANTVYLTIFDLSEKSTIKSIYTWDRNFTNSNCRLILLDDQNLLILDNELLIYDISDVTSPRLISSLPLGINEPEPYISSHRLSPDNKILFVETYDRNEFNKLRIYNISDLKSPRLVTEKSLSKFNSMYMKPQFGLSADMKTGYVFQDSSLVRLNLRDLKQPKISGVIPLSNNTNEQQEKFMLGEKYSDNIAMLNISSSSSDYELMDTSAYQVIKLSLQHIQVAPNKYSLDVTTPVLPSWIAFDRNSNFLTIEAKKQRDLGMYTFYSAFSLKIPETIFDNLGTVQKPVSSEDLVAWLISLDYVDSQLYLTASFASIDTFFLPAQFSDHKAKIYNLLKQFYVETSTSFEIVSSLELKDDGKNKLAISTPSSSSVKVEIKLEPQDGSDAKFLNKPYASLLPAIKDANKTQVSLEGLTKEINSALGSRVVNFENGNSCDATITIIDGLNPALTVSVSNISKYFKSNKPPMENKELGKTLQEQIDLAGIETGKYFAFSFEEETFTDEYTEILTYEIEMANNETAYPTWLSLSGLTLKGTPPEEVLGRDIELILIAKNEFKQYGVPFNLHIKISSVFVFKLILRYSPYILTLVGLLVSANKIFNIVAKRERCFAKILFGTNDNTVGIKIQKKIKFKPHPSEISFGAQGDKHPKEFFVSVGEEVGSEAVFPISFIEDENDQSRLVLKQMRKKIPKRELPDYFVGQDGQRLDKEKIVEKIQEAIADMPSAQKELINVEKKPLIEQIIINRFVSLQLNSKREVKTKLLFNELKTDCMEVVERGTSEFTIDPRKLYNLIKRIKGLPREANENLNESLISTHDSYAPEGVNMSLLKDAILAYAFDNHSLDILSVDVDISIKQVVKTGILFKFLKLDLRDIFLNDKHRLDYGINYKIFDDKLCFYGLAQNHMKGKKFVVQITSLRHQILKEILIHGVSSEFQKDQVYLLQDEREARGHNYEIF